MSESDNVVDYEDYNDRIADYEDDACAQCGSTDSCDCYFCENCDAWNDWCYCAEVDESEEEDGFL